VTEPKTPFSTQVTKSLQARTRATVRGVAAATGTQYSLSQLVEEALEAYCAALEEQYHQGQPWIPSEQPLQRGARLTG
jgi:hypothetical protein